MANRVVKVSKKASEFISTRKGLIIAIHTMLFFQSEIAPDDSLKH